MKSFEEYHLYKLDSCRLKKYWMIDNYCIEYEFSKKNNDEKLMMAKQEKKALPIFKSILKNDSLEIMLRIENSKENISLMKKFIENKCFFYEFSLFGIISLNNETIGYIDNFSQKSNCASLESISIEKNYRKKGLGFRAIKLLVEESKKNHGEKFSINKIMGIYDGEKYAKNNEIFEGFAKKMKDLGIIADYSFADYDSSHKNLELNLI